MHSLALYLGWTLAILGWIAAAVLFLILNRVYQILHEAHTTLSGAQKQISKNNNALRNLVPNIRDRMNRQGLSITRTTDATKSSPMPPDAV